MAANWFSKGLRFCVIPTAITATLIPHTFGLKKYRIVTSSYTNGIPTRISSHTRMLIDQTIAKMELEHKKKDLSFFIYFDNNPAIKGTVRLRWGAAIGLPMLINFETEADIDRSTMFVGMNNKHVNFDKDSGKELIQSLLLSDKAKLFMIARQLYYARTYYVFLDYTMKFMGFSAGYFFMYHTLELLAVNPRIRFGPMLGIYGCFCAIGYFVYVVLADLYFCHRERRADMRVSEISSEHAEGGLEYYEKTLQRNVAIRDQLGSVYGPQKYTLFGNEVGTWRSRHVDFTERRDQMRKYLENYPDMEKSDVKNLSKDDAYLVIKKKS